MKNKKYYETNEFKNIQQEWYAKLKDQGFHDLEANQENPNIIYPDKIYTNSDLAKPNAYYEAIEAMVERTTFPIQTHRVILQLHAQGLSRRKIAKALKLNPNLKPLKQSQIYNIIRRYTKDIAN